MEQLQTPNRPSGLPRPVSRLPVLTKRSSQIFVPKQQDIQEPVVTSKSGTVATKRSSVASLPRSTPNPARAAAPAVSATSTRKPAVNGTRTNAASRPPLSSRPIPLRSSSRANQGSSRTQSPSKPSVATEDEENHDQLSSLDSFRSASRQGFLDDSSPVEFVEPAENTSTPKPRKTSRPSLSDRTLESLQSLPMTPKERRRSSFFSPMSPDNAQSRPTSSLSRHNSSNSRPGTSDGVFVKPTLPPPRKAPASAKPATRTAPGSFGLTPRNAANKRSVSSAFTSRLQSAHEQPPPMPRSPSPAKRASPHKPAGLSKTLAARPSKARPALSDAFAPPPKPATTAPNAAPVGAKRIVSNPSNSSAVLREQIAAAKAAARKAKDPSKHDSPQDAAVPNGAAFGPNTHADPFNLAPKDSKHMIRNRINAARMDGKLNISAMGLKTIPDDVMSMYDAAAMEASNVSWAEVVDMTRFIAADNELEVLDDHIFPDKAIEDFETEDQTAGNQFGGLETLDLHGNSLGSLPLGLRRLGCLTSLNLAYNKLDNGALEVIAQIKPLKELRLGHNQLSGNLPVEICSLTHLEILDLQSNRILGLPEALRELVSLKVINVSGNQLTTLPMEAMQELPLLDLDASSNALIGSLFPLGGSSGHKSLRDLKVANNSLAALTFAEILDLPVLRTLDVTNNHLTKLPDMSGWRELITLAVGDHKIPEIPAGFTSLQHLRNANFTGNNLRVLDPEIARMDALEYLILASNPLQQKKYLTMDATDIKRDLETRLEPAEQDDSMLEGEVDEVSFTDASSTLAPAAASKWVLKANGLLDLANQGLSDDINQTLGAFLQSHEVRQLHLQGNKLTSIPPALWLGQELRVLYMSNNPLDADILPDELELPELQELDISKCGLRSLDPLISQLRAPKLKTLHVTANRLTGSLPRLRVTYPALATLFANDNKVNSISADALRGLQTVNLASNEIAQLPAEIGLLWDEGLKNFEVGSNAFRVPNYRVLEKGTEATLRWLREKLPAANRAHQESAQ